MERQNTSLFLIMQIGWVVVVTVDNGVVMNFCNTLPLPHKAMRNGR